MQVAVHQVYGFGAGQIFLGSDFYGRAVGLLRRHSSVIGDATQQTCTEQNHQRDPGDFGTYWIFHSGDRVAISSPGTLSMTR